MTKADQIRVLLRQGKSTRKVAMEVFALDENAPPKLVATKIAYVRAARQRSPDYVRPPEIESKASEIMALLHSGKTAREIAIVVFALNEHTPKEIVYSRTQYVHGIVRAKTGLPFPINEVRARRLSKVAEMKRKVQALRANLRRN